MEMTMIGWLHQLGTLEFWEALLEGFGDLGPIAPVILAMVESFFPPLPLIAIVALNVAGRAVFFMLPEFKPVVAMTILAGVAFGGETGFLVGAMTMLVSNMLFSQGPWTPWQMFAMGIIGFLAGVLFRRGWLRRSRAALCVFGAISAVLIYGGIMNPASALMYSQETNWKVLVTYYITGFPMDCVHAAATVLFLLVLAEPMLEKLDRIKTKYGLVE